jgi:hypothetical protein
MDLNIVREVKGSMPDVVYPHKQHTEWLDCSNCHPAIFVPQKGANQISMASHPARPEVRRLPRQGGLPGLGMPVVSLAQEARCGHGRGQAMRRAALTCAAVACVGIGPAVAAPAVDEAARAPLEQRLRLVATLMSDGPTQQRVLTSGQPRAQAHLDEGRVHHALAQDLLARGDLAGARREADEALRHLGLARRLAPMRPRGRPQLAAATTSNWPPSSGCSTPGTSGAVRTSPWTAIRCSPRP